MNIFNSWIIWVIIYIILAVVFAQSFKKANRNMQNAGSLTILLEFFTAIFAIFFIPFFEMTFPTDAYIYFILLFVIIIYAFTDRLNIEARYGLEPSTFSMLKQTSTVFLLLLGIFILKEPFGLKKLLGAVLIITGNILLFFDKGKLHFYKYFVMSLISNLLFAIAMFININVADYFNLGFYTLITVLIPAILIFVFEKQKVIDLVKEFKLYDKNAFFIAAFSWCVMLISSVRAYQLNSISIVAPILTTTAIANAIVEYVNNKDRSKLYKKIVLFILILLGVILVKA